MPKHCCVPGCRSNYASTSKEEGYVSVFKFPSDEKRKDEWIRNIPRGQWKPTVNSVVCIKHFSESDVETIEHFTNQYGEQKCRKRDKPTLKPCAVPRVFPNLPKYLSKSDVVKRKDPCERQREILHKKHNKEQALAAKDKINHFF